MMGSLRSTHPTGWYAFAPFPPAGKRLFAQPMRIERNTRRAIECAREFVEQLKKASLFARRESGQRAGPGFLRWPGELRKQFLACSRQLQAVPAPVVRADRPHHQAIVFELLEHHSGGRAIEAQEVRDRN